MSGHLTSGEKSAFYYRLCWRRKGRDLQEKKKQNYSFMPFVHKRLNRMPVSRSATSFQNIPLLLFFVPLLPRKMMMIYTWMSCNISLSLQWYPIDRLNEWRPDKILSAWEFYEWKWQWRRSLLIQDTGIMYKGCVTDIRGILGVRQILTMTLTRDCEIQNCTCIDWKECESIISDVCLIVLLIAKYHIKYSSSSDCIWWLPHPSSESLLDSHSFLLLTDVHPVFVMSRSSK